MSHKIEISSLVVNKLKNSHDDFIKYDIDVALDEVENNESGIKLKYKIILLSNPTNTKLTVEGIASLFGNDSEISKQLEPDQKNVPAIVNAIYQDIFPLIYIISKSVQIPCPSYKLSEISSIPQETKPEEYAKKEPVEQIADNSKDPIEEIQTEQIESPLEPASEPVIQEANVSSI